MKLDDTAHTYRGAAHIVVLFNATPDTVTFTNPALQGLDLQLDPVQQNSADIVVRQSTFNPKTGTATVPGLTTAVFLSHREGN